MLFNSIEFIIFFPIVTLAYFLLPHRFRWFHLLMASCIFYSAFIPVYILILFFTIIIDYFAGIMIENAPSHRKKSFLIISLIANIGVLAIFKYYNFFIDNMNELLHSLNIQTNFPLLEIILPIGLSFHTFQAMSYTIEVYRGNQKAERHFGIYALYVMYYPQLVAGPIERPQNVLHQLKEKHYFDYKRVVSGLQLMAWGMFKKVVIADRVAMFVNNLYENPTQYDSISIIVGTFFFAIQIYCDFSGYSDIALGASEIMGIRLMKNFRQPYLSKNISEFWTRWHISLSTWFKDYVYIPLGGNRVSPYRQAFNLMIVFLISGFWHGANWTFIVWGAFFGVLLSIEVLFRKAGITWPSFNEYSLLQRINIFSKVIFTFSLVCFAWIFFRAPNMRDATELISSLSSGWNNLFHNLMKGESIMRYFLLGNPLKEFIITVLIIGILFFVDLLQNKYSSLRLVINTLPIYYRWPLYYAILLLILFFGVYNRSGFIYFQF